MDKKAQDALVLWQAATGAAIFGDGLIIALAVWTLRSSRHIDSTPFFALIAACLIGGFNIALILLGRKLQRQILGGLSLMAIVANVVLLAVLGLVGLLGMALLGGGGGSSGAQAQAELMVIVAPIAALVILNLMIMVRAHDGASVGP